jgi:hypothetical protein
MLMRLLTFRPGAPGEVTDQFLREVLLPGLVGQEGLQHAYCGRSVSDSGGRTILSVWDGRSHGDLSQPQQFEQGKAVLEPTIELLEASVALTFQPPAEAQILRIFRGRARQGQATAYLDAVREGTLRDVEAGRGPAALFLGMLDEERFVTVSAWSEWGRIEQATGGNIRQPIATRHSQLLVEGTAEHLEIVPNTVVLPADGASPARLAGAPGPG